MSLAKLTTTAYDSADYLTTPEAIREFLEAALEENDPEFFIKALGIAARSSGMNQIADKTGLGRESLYKSFASGKHPRFETVFKVIHALGLRMHVSPSIQA
jgi:probable addiction module antidote protein